MKRLIFATTLLLSFTKAFGQPPSYDDLNILYADGRYEKLVASASHYTEKDDTKKDALPQMWLGRGLYKISMSGTDDERFKNAYKESVGAVGKAIKLDKSGEVQSQYSEFFEEFKMSLVNMIRPDVENGDFKKASPWITKYYKLNMKSIGTKYLDGVAKFKGGDRSTANTLWKEADTWLAQVNDFDSWSPAEKELLKLGVMSTADAYVTAKQVDKAKTLLGKVKQWYEENEDHPADEEFMEKYNSIVN